MGIIIDRTVHLSSGVNMPLSYLWTCNTAHVPCLCSPRTLRSKKQQSSSSSQFQSLSLSQAATPRKTLSFSAANTPINNSSSSSSSIIQESNAASDASLLTSILDQSHLRQRTVTATTTTTSTSVDGHWGQLLKMWTPSWMTHWAFATFRSYLSIFLIELHHAGYTWMMNEYKYGT